MNNLTVGNYIIEVLEEKNNILQAKIAKIKEKQLAENKTTQNPYQFTDTEREFLATRRAISAIKGIFAIDYNLLFRQRADLTLRLERETDEATRELYEGTIGLMNGLFDTAVVTYAVDVVKLMKELEEELTHVPANNDAIAVDWCGWPAGTNKDEIAALLKGAFEKD